MSCAGCSVAFVAVAELELLSDFTTIGGGGAVATTGSGADFSERGGDDLGGVTGSRATSQDGFGSGAPFDSRPFERPLANDATLFTSFLIPPRRALGLGEAVGELLPAISRTTVNVVRGRQFRLRTD